LNPKPQQVIRHPKYQKTRIRV